MNQVTQAVSNFIKEDETHVDPISAGRLVQSIVLSQQNLLDACNDISRSLALMTREKTSKPDVIQRIAAARVAATVANERLSNVLKALENPASLGS